MARHFEQRDIIRQYSQRDMRYYLARGIGHLKPTVLRQLIHQTILLPNQFHQLVIELLEEHCTRFSEHSLQWEYPTNNPDILTRMIHYDMAWGGFHCDEPWNDSVHRRVHYFYDSEFHVRTQEMESKFIE